ncbi:TIR domain-containing protein [Chitinophaga tropicalis]|uniref:TIR domain-containing protein n=1 Tax=Chitinophaga tropicalis TaxID=2683588 RepID=A0A7K1U6L1_9BACT|nr:nucleotide-binding protein [Chitinophaga tropicalis]MVT10001.1 TIR domain-containing protein [Chitinophaga tropicalis]
MQAYKPRIFVSCIYKLEKDSPQRRIKDETIKQIRNAGFEPQIFMEAGLAEDMVWNFDTVYSILKKCDGAVILGLGRWSMSNEKESAKIPTEYNHYEGALAASLKLPLLILSEEGIADRGIFYNGGGFIYTSIPSTADNNWFNNDEYFIGRFNAWKRAVNNRFQVFLGYSGEAKDVANSLVAFLTNRLNLRVKEYRANFVQGGTILEEIENAVNTCQCAIFLFTASDKLENNENQASPRDNVIFEAGYFMKAKGKERVLIIREEGTKMPADIGGNIYLPLKNRNDISTIAADVQYFLENRL